MDFNTIELSRFNKSWGSVGYINQGKYYSSDGIRHWVSYAKFGNFNIDYNKQTISSATISFTASGGRYSDPTEIGVYFGLSKTDAETLQRTSNAFAARKYIATIGAHGKNGATRTITLNSDGLNKFMTYFNSTNPTLVFFSETDRDEHLTTTGSYSYNYVQLSNLILTIKTTPKAASFSNLPPQIVIGQSSELQATALSGSYTYKAIWNLGNQKTNPITGTQSGTVVSFKTNIPASWGSEFPTTTSASGSVTIETYSGSSKIGSNTNAITYSVPNYAVSTGGIKLSNPTDSTYYNNSKTSIVYLLNLSKIGISIEPTISYGSGLQRVEIIYNNRTIVSSNFPTSGNFTHNLTLNQSGKNTLEIKIYDRRGKSGSKSNPYTVEYDLPSLTNLVVARSSSTGRNQFDGRDLKITGTLTNASGLTLRYGTTFGTYNKSAALTSKTGYWHTTSNIFEPDIIYYLQITVTSDRYYKNDKTTRLTQTYLSQLESSAYLMHFHKDGKGVGIGGAAETGKIKFHWPSIFLKEVSVDGPATFNNTVSFNSTNKSLPITQGGTGATTAADARSNLGITPANIGALSLGGGTLTNTLTVPYLQIYKADNKWPALALGWENNAYYGSIFASMKNDTDTQKTMAGFFIKQTGSKYGEYYTLVPNARNDDTVKHTWHRIHSDKTHYPEIKNGEEITFTDEVFMGYITTSGKDLYITVPIAKSLLRADSVSITQMDGRLRCDGSYAIGSAEANASFITGLAGSSATIKKTTNSVLIYLKYQDTLTESGYCNNKTCAAAISTMRLKFTNSAYIA